MQDTKKCCDSCDDCACMKQHCCNGTCTCCKKEEKPLTREYLLEKKEKLEKKMQWVTQELEKMKG